MSSYLRQISSGDCFAFSPYLKARKDMVPWTGPLPWEKEEQVETKEETKKAAIAIALPEEPVRIDPPKSDDEKKETAEEFKCEVCGFVAKSKLGLAAHLRTHNKK